MKTTDYNTRDINPSFLPFNYKKHKVVIHETEEPTFNVSVNSYWNGGSKSYYTMLEVNTRKDIPLITDPTTSFPKFTERSVEVPIGYCIIESGTFCGKPATCRIYCHKEDTSKIVKDNATQHTNE